MYSIGNDIHHTYEEQAFIQYRHNRFVMHRELQWHKPKKAFLHVK